MPKPDSAAMALANVWFDDVTDRRLEGRYIDTGIDNPNPQSPHGGTKTILAIEIRPRSSHAGGGDSNCIAIRPHNENEMQHRFPAAWTHYSAAKSGRPLVSEKKTEIPWGILSRAQTSRLALEGYDSLERLLAAPNHELIAVLGARGPDLRDQIKAEVARTADVSERPAPSSTPIEVKGPIDEMTLAILHSRTVVLYEELAALPDTAVWAFLGPKGEECREFARQELRDRLTPLVPTETLDAASINELRSIGVVSFEQLRQLNRAKVGTKMLDSHLAELVAIAEGYLKARTSGAPTTHQPHR